MEPCPEPTLTNPWVLVGLCPFTPHKIHYFHPYHYYHITHYYYYYLVLFHFHYSLLLLLLMTCHLSPHQRHSRLYNVTRLLYILGQSLSTFFSIVLTKTFAVETTTFLSVSSLLRDCSKNLPSPTYAVAMSLYQIMSFWAQSDFVILRLFRRDGPGWFSSFACWHS